MIVTCSNCDTSFQLDDSRVPEQGIRVRCSRCKQSFFLKHPSASSSEAADAIAGDTAQAGGAGSPDVTQDLPADDHVGSAGAGDDDEHDWEFNVDPIEEKPSSADDSDSSVGVLNSKGSSGLELEGEDTANEAIGEDESESESAFGSVDDYSSLMDEDEDSTANVVDEEVGEPTSDGSPTVDTAATNLADAGQYGTKGSTEDLGEPENWDFTADDAGIDASKPSGLSLDVRRESDAFDLNVRDSSTLGDGGVRIGTLGKVWTGEAEDDYEGDVAASGPLARSLKWAGQGIGWAATVALVGLGLASGFSGIARSLSNAPQSMQVGPFRAEAVHGEWVDTSRGETVLTIVGELRPAGKKAVAAGGIIEVTLLGIDGQPLDMDSQPAGLPVSMVALRESDPDRLRVAQDRAAWSLANLRIQPGGAAPFQAIFRDVPFEAARVDIRVSHDTMLTPVGVSTEVVPMVTDPSIVSPDRATLPAAAPPMPSADAVTGAGAPADRPIEPAQEPKPLPSELTWGD